jgi:uncharacterized protein YjbJ (UPF0337 family)
MTTSLNVSPDWITTKAKIKAKWSKFTDQDIDNLQKSMDGIVGYIQKAYSLTKEQAESQYNDFKTSLEARPKTDASKLKVTEMSALSAMKKN